MSVAAESMVRDVSDGEVATFGENGWVYLPGYMNTSVAGEMLAFLKDTLGEDGRGEPDATVFTNSHLRVETFFRDWRFIARDEKVEPFASLCTRSKNGKNVGRFMARQVGVKLDCESMLLKLPQGDQMANTQTDWHQDWPNVSHDRVGYMTIWTALEDIPAERGSMRFLTGSHREGPLGRTLRGNVDLITQYPHLLDRYEISPPLDLKAGDATAHSGLVVHSAPANSTDRPRWAYSIGYFPADARYTGEPFSNTDGIGLTIGEPLEHPRFPVVYSPEA